MGILDFSILRQEVKERQFRMKKFLMNDHLIAYVALMFKVLVLFMVLYITGCDDIVPPVLCSQESSMILEYEQPIKPELTVDDFIGLELVHYPESGFTCTYDGGETISTYSASIRFHRLADADRLGLERALIQANCLYTSPAILELVSPVDITLIDINTIEFEGITYTRLDLVDNIILSNSCV